MSSRQPNLNRMNKNLVIGAGITGLSLASAIPNSVVFEKSKGLGGRLATRRWQNQKFDHGAQFYKLTPDTEKWHHIWQSHQLVKNRDDSRWCAISGISSLAKKMAENLDIKLEKQVRRIIEKNQVQLLDGNTESFDSLFLTCPLPQSLKILDDSNIQYPDRLRNIKYAKALVFLISSEESVTFPFPTPYIENPTNDIFSFTDQNWKTNLPGSAWTITMNPQWSEKYFDFDDQKILEELKSVISFPTMNIQLKKWRYSHPISQDKDLFVKINNIYLAGDAFGGGSVNGALRSAAAVLQDIKT